MKRTDRGAGEAPPEGGAAKKPAKPKPKKPVAKAAGKNDALPPPNPKAAKAPKAKRPARKILTLAKEGKIPLGAIRDAVREALAENSAPARPPTGRTAAAPRPENRPPKPLEEFLAAPDPARRWCTIQLTSWGHKKLEGMAAIRERLPRRKPWRELALVYPVVEDELGKIDTGFGEYFFLEHRAGLDYAAVADGDVIGAPLAGDRGKPVLLSEAEVRKVAEQVGLNLRYDAGDVVRMVKGPLAGNDAFVLSQEGEMLTVEVEIGSRRQKAAVDNTWVRRVRAKD